MALPFRGSGGTFTGTIVAATVDSTDWLAKKGKPYTTFSVKLKIRPDGADKTTKRFLQGGFLYDEHTISGDNLSIEGGEDSVVLPDSELGRFLQSAADAGFDESVMVDSLFRRFDWLDNQRFTFKFVVDIELTKQFGKQKGKDGKAYNRGNFLVAEYLGEADAKQAKKAAGKSTKSDKSAPKSTAAKGGKANGAAKEDSADIVKAEEVLLGVLADAGAAVPRTGLSAKIVRYSTENRFSEDAAEHNAIRETMRKLIGSEDFLSRQNGWTYDPKGKGQPVALA